MRLANAPALAPQPGIRPTDPGQRAHFGGPAGNAAVACAADAHAGRRPGASAKPPLLPAPLVTPAAETQPPLGWTALSSIAWNKDMNAPKSIRFPDGNEYPIQRWRNLAVSAAQWLWSKSLLTHRNLPVPAPGRSSRYVVSTEAVHQSGQPFTTQQPIAGTPLIVEVNVGGNQAIDYARALLQHCGVNPADVFVQTSQ